MTDQRDLTPVLAQMNTALDALASHLDPVDMRDARDYLDHGEYGVAWELVWHIVQEDGLTVPHELVAAGRAMGFDPR